MHWLQAPIITTALKDSSSLSTNTVITADLDLQQFVSKKRINRRHSSPHISYSPGPEPPPMYEYSLWISAQLFIQLSSTNWFKNWAAYTLAINYEHGYWTTGCQDESHPLQT